VKSDTPIAAIPADVRQVMVRQLGAALAEAWRREHQHTHNEDTEKVQTNDAPSSSAAVCRGLA
jgi:hypothetical protein